MRRWIPIALIAVAVLWYILQNVGSSMALSDAFARPILALTQNGQRVPVQQPGLPPAEGEARADGAAGISFGFSFTYVLPDGTLVTCNHRFRSLTCDQGWIAERGT
ncbi:MAG: hypothetical protein MUE83_16820 [Tabrizicola sp.]|jgi:hypothetical protein|nr:hypothetical protein [Tabrizicola sp.]